MNHLRNKFVYLGILLISVFCVVQSKIIYDLFMKDYLPVYDGVMYEKNQILRYLAFKGDFSFMERINQVIYEYMGNPVSGGFNSFLILLNPNFLINDYDIWIKSVIGLFLLFTSIKLFFDFENKFYYLAICLLISQVPILYHFRIGLSTYVPDLFSSILLLSSYFFTLSFVKKNKISFFTISILLVVFSVISRFNFFVFTFLVYLPIIPAIFNQLKSINYRKSNTIIHIIIITFSILFLAFYVYYNFHDFLNYYAKPATYATVTVSTSLQSILSYFNEELGVAFILILITILVLVNRIIYKNNNFSPFKKLNRLLILPFVFLFIFLVFILNATNQPHVFSILVIFLIPIAFIKIPFQLSGKTLYFILFLVTITFSSARYIKFYNSVTHRGLKINTLDLAKNIDRLSKYDRKKSYFILFDTAQEIPLDIYFYKKYHVFNNNNIKFYFTDWDYYDIDKNLNINNIVALYKKQILSQKPKIIVVNEYKLKLGKDRRLAEKINQTLNQFVEKSLNYKKVLVKKIDNKNLVFYKLN